MYSSRRFSDERTELPGCEDMILLDSILCYIHQHYKERLPLAKIAKEVNVSVSHLSKFLKIIQVIRFRTT